MSETGDVTKLLSQMRGEEDVAAKLFPLLLKLRLDRHQRFLKRRSCFVDSNLPNDTAFGTGESSLLRSLQRDKVESP